MTYADITHIARKFYGMSEQVPPEVSRLDDGLNVWMINYAKLNYWRVASWYELSDLIMDGYFILAKCEEKYPEVSQRDFMNLFKRAYFNHITDLANARTKSPNEVPFSDLGVRWTEDGEEASDEYMLQHIMGGEEDDTAEIVDLIRRAPWEVQQLLKLFFTEEGQKKIQGAMHDFGGLRGDHNTRLCRIAGLDPNEVNLVEEVRAYLTPKRKSYLDALAEACDELGVETRRFRWAEAA